MGDILRAASEEEFSSDLASLSVASLVLILEESSSDNASAETELASPSLGTTQYVISLEVSR